MNINKATKQPSKLKELSGGTPFRYLNSNAILSANLFMKFNKEISDGKINPITAVDLSNGEPARFGPDTEVMVVDAEIKTDEYDIKDD